MLQPFVVFGIQKSLNALYLIWDRRVFSYFKDEHDAVGNVMVEIKWGLPVVWHSTCCSKTSEASKQSVPQRIPSEVLFGLFTREGHFSRWKTKIIQAFKGFGSDLVQMWVMILWRVFRFHFQWIKYKNDVIFFFFLLGFVPNKHNPLHLEKLSVGRGSLSHNASLIMVCSDCFYQTIAAPVIWPHCDFDNISTNCSALLKFLQQLIWIPCKLNF